MPLTLVTGPANAEKARRRAGRLPRARCDREPLLVVPTAADVEHYRRELAAARRRLRRARSSTLRRADRRDRERAGVAGRAAGRRSRASASPRAAIGRARLDVLRAVGARRPASPRALLRLADELEERRVEPGRWYGALRAWAAEEPGRAAYAEELGALYGAYRDALGRLGRRDRTLHARRRARRAAPRARALGRHAGAALRLRRPHARCSSTPSRRSPAASAPTSTVSLTYEPGRAAFAGRGATFQELAAIAAEHVALPARAEHYAAAARALHHLERRLFEAGAAPRAAAPGGAVRAAGGRRRARRARARRRARAPRLLREGTPAEEIAVVLRDRERRVARREVFAAYGRAGRARARASPPATPRSAAASLALLRCALRDGSADDLSPSCARRACCDAPSSPTASRQDVRVAGESHRRRGAGALGGRAPDLPLDELDRVAAAAAREPERAAASASQREVARCSRGAVARPARACSPAPRRLDARVARALRGALARAAARSAARRPRRWCPTPASWSRSLERLEVRAGERPRPGRRRGRRPAARCAPGACARCSLCGLQEGVVPAPAAGPSRSSATTSARAINAAGGLRLRAARGRPRRRALPVLRRGLAADRAARAQLGARPTTRARPLVRSLFVDDVLDLVDATLATEQPARWAAAGLRRAAGADRARGASAPARAERTPAPAPHVAPLRDADGARRPAPRARRGRRRRWRPTRAARSSGSSSGCCAPTCSSPTPSRCCAASSPTRILEDAFRELADGGGR